MKKPIPPHFPYIANDLYADRKQKQFNEKFDINDRALTNWNIFVFVTTLITGGILATALVYLAHQYRKNIFALLRAIDELPPLFWCIFTGACVMAIVLVWRGKKDRVNSKL